MEKYLLKDAWDYRFNDCNSCLSGVILGFNKREKIIPLNGLTILLYENF